MGCWCQGKSNSGMVTERMGEEREVVLLAEMSCQAVIASLGTVSCAAK